jgi:hypothetical protein
VDALLIACMHRATHKENPYYVDGVAHYSANRLVWLYDIHLLLASLSQEQTNEFLRRSEAKGLCAVCLDGIENARACFGTPVTNELLAALGRPGPLGEAPARYLAASRWRQQWMDFVALGSWFNRARFLGETVLPPAAYLRQKYAHAHGGQGFVGWLYLRRAWQGLTKRLFRSV